MWSASQIVKLFDSLMRGYPVGSFLLLNVKRDTAQSYTFYRFLTHFHERDNPYVDKATVLAGTGTTAVLDDQQRLTSLNIALYGSIAEKRKYAWWSSPEAFPVKKLYLNLVGKPKGEELGLSTTCGSSLTRRRRPSRTRKTSGSVSEPCSTSPARARRS